MPRIPDELLSRIKQEVPLEELIGRRVELKPHGGNLLGLCPLHADRSPSLVVTAPKGLWHCMGACQTGGTAIDWVMRTEGVSFRHAADILLSEFFPLESSRLSPPKRSTVRVLASPVAPEATEEEMKRQVVAYYHEALKESPEALAYLEKRGLTHPDLASRFQLGFSNRTLGLRLPLTNRKAGYEIRMKLQSAGIYRASGHEHFVGCLVIPVLGEDGSVAEIYGRRIDDPGKAGAPKHLYLPGPHRGVFNAEGLRGQKEVILCEALIDALTFWSAGFRNVTSSYGVEGFTPDHLALFTREGVEHVLIAYDRDEAGDRAAETLGEKLAACGIATSRVLFPKGMDANDYARKVTPPEKSLGLLLRTAEWMGAGARPAAAAAAPAGARLCTQPVAPPVTLAAAPAVPAPAAAAKEPSLAAAEPAGASAPAAPGLPEEAAKEESLAGAAEPAAPAGPQAELAGDDEALFRYEDRSYRVRGLKKALRSGGLHVSVEARREGELFTPPSPLSGWFLDRFDFVSSRQRTLFEKQASHEMGVRADVVRWDLGRILRSLEELQRKAIAEALKPSAPAHVLTEEERAEALELLTSEDLAGRILADFERCGVAGEETNKLLGYLAAVSRKLERPLAVIVRSSSAAGKTALMEAVLALVPKEDREKYSALSEHSLFYFEGKDFKHKVLAIVEEEGAQKAAYALKLLQSEGEITIASTGKDPGSGKLVTKEYRVEGPVMIILATTAVEVDEELLNRALVLTVDEGREQTRRIHRLQREKQTLEGLFAREEREEVYRRHHNAQRLLRPLHVVNPFVRELTFLDDRTRTRRDHVKYLTLIESIALLHQYQRPVKAETRFGRTKEYIEVRLSDIALANRLAAEVLGRSLDELPPQTRRLLELLDGMVGEACGKNGVERADLRFTIRDVRRATGWSHDQVWRHMQRLVSLEYVLVHRGGRGQSFVYELLYDGQGQDGEPFLIGLCDAEGLTGKKPESMPTSAASAGAEATSAGGFGGASGAFRVPSAVPPIVPEPASRAALVAMAAEAGGNGGQGSLPEPYAQPGRSHRDETVRPDASASGALAHAAEVPGNGHEGPHAPVLDRPARPYVLRAPGGVGG